MGHIPQPNMLLVFETVSHHIALAGLEPTISSRLASNSERSACLCVLGAEINGVWHHSPGLAQDPS